MNNDAKLFAWCSWFSREKFTKLRNLLGFAKDLPEPEMAQLMPASAVSVTRPASAGITPCMRGGGRFSQERVFVLAPKEKLKK